MDDRGWPDELHGLSGLPLITGIVLDLLTDAPFLWAIPLGWWLSGIP